MFGGFLTTLMLGIMGGSSVADSIRNKEIKDKSRDYAKKHNVSTYSANGKTFLTENDRRVYEYVVPETGVRWYKDSKTHNLVMNDTEFYYQKYCEEEYQKAKRAGFPVVEIRRNYGREFRHWLEDMETKEQYCVPLSSSTFSNAQGYRVYSVYYKYKPKTGYLRDVDMNPESSAWVECKPTVKEAYGEYRHLGSEWRKMKRSEVDDFIKQEAEKYNMTKDVRKSR